MPDLADRIRQLDPATAARILRTVAGYRLASGQAERLDPDAPATAALARDAGVSPDPTPATAGEVVEVALLLLAEDPTQRGAIEQMIAHPPPESGQTYSDPATILPVVALALVVLQSHVKVKKVPGKGWSFEFEKKPMENSLLKLFIQKLTAFLPGK